MNVDVSFGVLKRGLEIHNASFLWMSICRIRAGESRIASHILPSAGLNHAQGLTL
jgi:hypothetical protein